VSYRLIGYALVLAPLTLVLGLAFNRLMASARQAALTRSWLLIPAIAGAGLLTVSAPAGGPSCPATANRS